MIIPDVNLLLYAYDAESAFHTKAAAWWQECLSGYEQVGLPEVVIFGFVRIVTNARVVRSPTTPAEAVRRVNSWIARREVFLVEPSAGHVDRVFELLKTLGTAGNLVTDAQIAAFAIEHDAVVHTADADFLRFSGLRWFNPMTGIGSESLPRS